MLVAKVKVKGNKTREMEEKKKTKIKNGVKCMFTNMRSLMNENKREELEMIVMQEQIDVIGVTESWTHEGINDGEISLKGYTMFRRDRKNGIKERGGGVILYVKDSIGAVREIEGENE